MRAGIQFAPGEFQSGTRKLPRPPSDDHPYIPLIARIPSDTHDNQPRMPRMLSSTSLRKDCFSEDDVSYRVRLTLNQCGPPAFHDLDVCEENGAIVLSGRLPSFYLKQLVQTVAGSVDGVRRLDNRVEVVRSAAWI
jgi:hypothetical protein